MCNLHLCSTGDLPLLLSRGLCRIFSGKEGGREGEGRGFVEAQEPHENGEVTTVKLIVR